MKRKNPHHPNIVSYINGDNTDIKPSNLRFVHVGEAKLLELISDAELYYSKKELKELTEEYKVLSLARDIQDSVITAIGTEVTNDGVIPQSSLTRMRKRIKLVIMRHIFKHFGITARKTETTTRKEIEITGQKNKADKNKKEQKEQEHEELRLVVMEQDK
jgi:hypothetical protein